MMNSFSNSTALNILAISGSLRAQSSNKYILQAASQLAEKEFSKDLQVSLYDEIGELPHFNPDLEQNVPATVIHFRNQIAKSSGLIISSPEYAHGIPGSLKNALDWLVADPRFEGKPIVLLNAAVGGAEYAQPQLIEILKTMSARLLFVVAFSGPSVRKALDDSGNINDAEILQQLRQALGTFLVRKSPLA